MQLQIKLRTVEQKPEVMRMRGFTKNHKLVELSVCGHWYGVGCYTQKQIDNGKHLAEADNKMRTNGGYKGKEPIVFVMI